jgi:hypothetical protein
MIYLSFVGNKQTAIMNARKQKNPTDRERDDLDETIWQMVHGWCDQQYHDIPDDSRRYLMDQIKSLVINTTSDEQSSQGTINN